MVGGAGGGREACLGLADDVGELLRCNLRAGAGRWRGACISLNLFGLPSTPSQLYERPAQGVLSCMLRRTPAHTVHTTMAVGLRQVRWEDDPAGDHPRPFFVNKCYTYDIWLHNQLKGRCVERSSGTAPPKFVRAARLACPPSGGPQRLFASAVLGEGARERCPWHAWGMYIHNKAPPLCARNSLMPAPPSSS